MRKHVAFPIIIFIGLMLYSMEVAFSAQSIREIAISAVEAGDRGFESLKSSVGITKGNTMVYTKGDLLVHMKPYYSKLATLREKVHESYESFLEAIELVRSDPNPDVRAIIQNIGVASAEDPALIDEVLKLLQDENPGVRKAAINALTPNRFHTVQTKKGYPLGGPDIVKFSEVEIKREDIRQALLKMLESDPDDSVRLNVIWSLQYSQAIDPGITTTFIKCFGKWQEKELRAKLINALGDGGTKEAVNFLLAMLGKIDGAHRLDILQTMSGWRTRGIIDDAKLQEVFIGRLYNDKHEEVRAMAAVNLSSFSSPTVAEALRKALKQETSEKVRHAIKTALEINRMLEETISK